MLVPGRGQPGGQRGEHLGQRLVRDAGGAGQDVVASLVAGSEAEQAPALVERGANVEPLVGRAARHHRVVEHVMGRPAADRRDGPGQAIGGRCRVRLVRLGRLDGGRAGLCQARDAGQQPEQADGDGHEHAS